MSIENLTYRHVCWHTEDTRHKGGVILICVIQTMHYTKHLFISMRTDYDVPCMTCHLIVSNNRLDSHNDICTHIQHVEDRTKWTNISKTAFPSAFPWKRSLVISFWPQRVLSSVCKSKGKTRGHYRLKISVFLASISEEKVC